jgi:protease II
VPPLFKVNMDAGHGGASGRYDYLREIAFDYAFILTRLSPFLRGPLPSPPSGERAG